jgi:hypothetical protein
MPDSDAGGPDGKDFVSRRKISDYHARSGEGTERHRIEEKLRNCEHDKTKDGYDINVLQENPLCKQQYLIDKEYEEKENERHPEG